MSRFRHLIAFSAFVLSVSLACGLPLRKPTPPASPIPVTTEAVEELNQELQSAAEQSQTQNTIDLEVTEAQVTSYLVLNLQPQLEGLLQDPQVFLRDGQIQIFGLLSRGGLKADARLIVTVQIDADGHPVLTLESVNLGAFTVPAGLTDTLQTAIDDNLTEFLDSGVSDEYRIDNLTIADGVMKIRASRR